jgi:hypothetical protein
MKIKVMKIKSLRGVAKAGAKNMEARKQSSIGWDYRSYIAPHRAKRYCLSLESIDSLHTVPRRRKGNCIPL